MNIFKILFGRKKKRPAPVLGLALGSGGAKGFAALGVVAALEENGVYFDRFAGTSIGSIIGAFLAAGYSSSNISSLLKTVDAGDIKSAFMINMDTSKLFRVIDDTIGNLDIEELKKPFRAVATDLKTGTEKVFSSGSVARALCASSSMPPFFKAVDIDGGKYIDGAFVNSVPADVVKSLGADFVVGIDISSHSYGKSLLTKFFPSFRGGADKPWQKGYDNADFMFHPDLSGYKSTDFKKAYEMFDIGYDLALAKAEELKAAINKKAKDK